MGLPAKQRTNRSKRERAAHFALKVTTTNTCKSCGAATLPHRACASCGSYKGKKVVNAQKRVERTLRNKKAVQ